MSTVGHSKPAPSARLRPQLWVLAAMLSLLTVYIALHSPLRGMIAGALHMTSRGCFFCTGTFSMAQWIDSCSALGLVVVALVAAWIACHRVGGPAYEQAILFGLGALGFITVPASVIGEIGTWAGRPFLRPPAGLWSAAVPAVVFIAVSVRHGWPVDRPRLEVPARTRLLTLLGACCVVALFASAAIGITHPATGYDALGYHAPLARFLWRDGNLTTFLDRVPDMWPLAHPGTAELWFGLLRILGGERLANVAQLPFAILGGIAVYAFARRLGLRDGAARLAAFAFLLEPMVVAQSGMQLNDVAGAALLAAAVALAAAPIRDWTRTRLAAIGYALGLVAATKLALLPGVAAVGVYTTAVLAWKHGSLRSLCAQAAIVAVCALVVVAPWWIRNTLRYGNPVYPAALPLLGRGVVDTSKADAAFVPSPALWAVYPLVEKHDEQSGVGILPFISLVGFVFATRRARRHPILLYLCVTAVTVPAWWMLTQHFPRFLLPIAGLGLAFLPWSLMAVPRSQRAYGAAVIAVAALFSLFVTFDQALLPFARQPNTRSAFYDRVWGIDPVVLAVPEDVGVLMHTGFAPGIPQYAAYYALLGDSLTRTVAAIDGEATSGAIVERMRNAGVSYAYVAASPANRAIVESTYDREHFDLVAMSTIVPGEKSGARRYLFQPVAESDEANGTRRYLYRLNVRP